LGGSYSGKRIRMGNNCGGEKGKKVFLEEHMSRKREESVSADRKGGGFLFEGFLGEKVRKGPAWGGKTREELGGGGGYVESFGVVQGGGGELRST